MRTKFFALIILALLAVSRNLAAAPAWQLVWSDEFTDPNINPSNWTYDTGGGGWGNNELEYYTNRPENSRIVFDAAGNGLLLIEARKEQIRNRNYTSARLKTQGLQNWTYGRIEANIKVPNGQGVWPAFWMLGSNFPDVGWPNCGEIDVMEHVLPIGVNTVRGSAHGPNYSSANSLHGDDVLGDLSGSFHVFAIEWEPSKIR
jgi:beta-glucanase (GH16 family)